MTASLECPGIDYWQALLGDTISPELREDYESHLEFCSTCQDHLHRAEACSAGLRELGQKFGDPTRAPTDPTLSLFLERLRAGKEPERTATLTPADLYFLRPAERPGFLGILGDYEVLEVIGQGGMGVVLKALDRTLNRSVAIKVMSTTVAGSSTARRRFTREAKAAAAVCHENIVSVHGVYEADGLPYLVMQCVAGESLQSRLDRAGPLKIQEIIRVGLQTARGLAAAHEQGLIHRDIKPANLLLQKAEEPHANASLRLCARSASFTVKITDFGLAKMLDDTALTQTGTVAGTPEYMAPEQARGEPVDHRCDLFSLGSVLYAMCTGQPPFRASTAVAVLRQVSDEAPAPVRELNPDVPDWLEAVIVQLMEKDPAKRFQSAAEVAALLGSKEIDECGTTTLPVVDFSPPGFHRFGVRRVSLVLLSVVFVAVVFLALFWRLENLAQFAVADPPTVIPSATNGAVWCVAVSPDGKFVAAGAGRWDLPGEIGVWDLATAEPQQRFVEELGIASIAFSRSGNLLASGSWSGHVRVYDWANGKQIFDLPVDGVARVAFSPADSLLATVTEDKTAQLWDMVDGKLVADLEGDLFRFHCVAFSPDGKRVLAGGGDWNVGGNNQVTIWDVASKKQVGKLVGHRNAILGICFSPDGKTIATGSVDNTVRLWRAEDGKLLKTLRGHERWIESVVFSHDGTTIVSGSVDGTIRFWDVQQGAQKNVITRGGEIRTVRFFPDEDKLIAGGGKKTLEVIDVKSQQVLTALWNGAQEQKTAMDDFPIASSTTEEETGWLRAAGLAGLGLAFLISLSFAVGLSLRRSRAGRLATVGEDAPSRLSFSCSECGKSLKGKPELAGKKVNCPHCGNPTLVPEDKAHKAAMTPPTRTWSRGLVVAAYAVSGLLGGAFLVLGFWAPRPEPEPFVSQLQALANRVNSGKTDRIDARPYPTLADKDLIVFEGMSNLRELNLDNTGITDEGLKLVAGATNLKVLSLTNTRVSDAGLAELKPLTALEDLRLDKLPVTDAGLAHLLAFPRLGKLSLYQTGVTDNGLVHLKQLSELIRLSLDDTQVGDEGIRHLSRCSNLRYLSVWKTRASAAGILQLQRSLPMLKVNR